METPDKEHASGSDPWATHPDYTLDEWRLEVAEDNTRLGYLKWREHQLSIAADEKDIGGIAIANPGAIARGIILSDPPQGPAPDEGNVEVRRLAIVSALHVSRDTYGMIHGLGMAAGGKGGGDEILRGVILSSTEWSATARPLDPDNLPPDTPPDLALILRTFCAEMGMDGVVLECDGDEQPYLPIFEW